MNAFCRVAPSLRLRLLAIILAGVLLRAADSSSRTSALVQARLFEFLLAMYDSPNLKTCLTLQQRASELCRGMTVAPKALKLRGRYEPATDRCDFDNRHLAAVWAGSTAQYCRIGTKGHRHHSW